MKLLSRRRVRKLKHGEHVYVISHLGDIEQKRWCASVYGTEHQKRDATFLCVSLYPTRQYYFVNLKQINYNWRTSTVLKTIYNICKVMPEDEPAFVIQMLTPTGRDNDGAFI